MKRTIKIFLIGICTVLLFVCSACGSIFAEKDLYTGFLEGYKQVVEVGSSISLNEYVDYIDDVEYTLFAKQGETTVDLTSRKSWDTSNPGLLGEWELVYTIESG